MFESKISTLSDVRNGTNNPLIFAASQNDQSITNMVANAIERKQVMLAYQPIMQSRDPSKVAFYEGLIRVLDASDQIIPAGDFMGVVENTELGRQLDTLALRLGLEALHNTPELRLSINLSVRSIEHRQWNRTLDRGLERDPLIAERLILEITESSAMTTPQIVVDFMAKLQGKGISFALDDFGAGCTSLSHFKDFSFDVLKIDGRFIQGIASDPDNQALTSALISIARHFDMITVAEFVETKEDAEALIELGVDCLQGYYFGAPSTRPYWMNERELQSAS